MRKSNLDWLGMRTMLGVLVDRLRHIKILRCVLSDRIRDIVIPMLGTTLIAIRSMGLWNRLQFIDSCGCGWDVGSPCRPTTLDSNSVSPSLHTIIVT